MDSDPLQEIPGYKAVLKSVIKAQIQFLVEQLCEQTGEESIILTASINEGTLSHLGSNMGKAFFVGRDEMKSQFLSYCLQKYHNVQGPEPRTTYQTDQTSDAYQQGPTTPKQQKLQYSPVTPVGNIHSMSQDLEDQGTTDFSDPVVQMIPSPSARKVKSEPKRSPHPAAKSPKPTTSAPVQTSDNMNSIALSNDGDARAVIVKIEEASFSEESGYTLLQGTTSELLNTSERVALPSSAHHSQRQPSETEEQTETDSNVSETIVSKNLSVQPSVKEELIEDGDLELEITGVELAGGATGIPVDWGQVVSEETGNQSAVADVESANQCGNNSTNTSFRDGKMKQKMIKAKEILADIVSATQVSAGNQKSSLEIRTDKTARPETLTRLTAAMAGSKRKTEDPEPHQEDQRQKQKKKIRWKMNHTFVNEDIKAAVLAKLQQTKLQQARLQQAKLQQAELQQQMQLERQQKQEALARSYSIPCLRELLQNRSDAHTSSNSGSGSQTPSNRELSPEYTPLSPFDGDSLMLQSPVFPQAQERTEEKEEMDSDPNEEDSLLEYDDIHVL